MSTNGKIIAAWDRQSGCEVKILLAKLAGAAGFVNVVEYQGNYVLVQADDWIDQAEALSIVQSGLSQRERLT